MNVLGVYALSDKVRTIYDKNEIIIYDDYAEVVLYNKKCIEVARTIIDIDDIEKISIHKWYLDNHGYATSRINDKIIHMHNYLYDNKNKIIDHIDMNKLNNSKSNFRLCTKIQNAMNSKTPCKNKSGFKGVSYESYTGKWRSVIGINGQFINLGRYDNLDDAIASRKEAELKYFGEFTPMRTC